MLFYDKIRHCFNMHRARKDRQICECLHVKLHKLSSGHDTCFIVAKEEKETFFFLCPEILFPAVGMLQLHC